MKQSSQINILEYLYLCSQDMEASNETVLGIGILETSNNHIEHDEDEKQNGGEHVQPKEETDMDDSHLSLGGLSISSGASTLEFYNDCVVRIGYFEDKPEQFTRNEYDAAGLFADNGRNLMQVKYNLLISADH